MIRRSHRSFNRDFHSIVSQRWSSVHQLTTVLRSCSNVELACKLRDCTTTTHGLEALYWSCGSVCQAAHRPVSNRVQPEKGLFSHFMRSCVDSHFGLTHNWLGVWHVLLISRRISQHKAQGLWGWPQQSKGRQVISPTYSCQSWHAPLCKHHCQGGP